MPDPGHHLKSNPFQFHQTHSQQIFSLFKIVEGELYITVVYFKMKYKYYQSTYFSLKVKDTLILILNSTWDIRRITIIFKYVLHTLYIPLSFLTNF